MTDLPPSLVAIGNFDGVHLGHQMLLDGAALIARTEGVRLVVLTFEPHPRTFFTPDAAPGLLTSRAVKQALLRGYGAETVFLPFNAEVAETSAEGFVTRILQQQLNAHFAVVGQDFRFGYQRAGDASFMRRYIKVATAPIKTTDNGHEIRSSRIRDLVAAGDLAAAEALLGRPHIAQIGETGILWPKPGLYDAFSSQNGSGWSASRVEIGQNGPISPVEPGYLIAFSPQKPVLSLNLPSVSA